MRFELYAISLYNPVLLLISVICMLLGHLPQTWRTVVHNYLFHYAAVTLVRDFSIHESGP